MFMFQASLRIKIENDILKRCVAKIKSKSMSADVFDEVQARVSLNLHVRNAVGHVWCKQLWIRILKQPFEYIVLCESYAYVCIS